MNKYKLKLWAFTTFLGLLGVASLLLSDLPVDNLPKELVNSFSAFQIKLLILINPVLLVCVAAILGTLLHDKVNLKAPIISNILNQNSHHDNTLRNIVKSGLLYGLAAGILIVIIGKLFEPLLPQELLEATKKLDLHPITKFLYGGIAEEILTRFGFMSLFVWVFYKITKKLDATIYWIGIVISALLFAMGHLPIVLQTISNPTWSVYAYIILGNSFGGLIFGYAYWKKGLECAFIAHIMAHVTMIAFNLIILN